MCFLSKVISENRGVTINDEINSNLSSEEDSNLATHVNAQSFRDLENNIPGTLQTINVSGGSNEQSHTADAQIILNELRTKNSERLIIAQININAVEHTFESLRGLVRNKVDIIMISETKIDESFPLSHGRGIMIFSPD